MSSTPLNALHPLQYLLRESQSSPTFHRAVVQEIWSEHLSAQEYQEYKRDYESYFIHIFQELSAVAGGGDSIVRDLKYEHIFGIVQKLKSQHWTRGEIATNVHAILGVVDSAQTQRAVNLAAALLVPLNFKGLGGVWRGEVISWQENETLSETIAKRIKTISGGPMNLRGTCASCSQSKHDRYGKNFNAMKLARIAGFEIIWTSNLMDHLLLQDEDDKVKVYIFHQLKVLENHLNFPRAVISQDLISETQDTLALLVPRTDHRVRNWYKTNQKHHTLDPSVLSLEYLDPSHRNADNFQYWGARLQRIKRAYDGHEPNGPLQWWRDDRKPVQWWTFWIAALVLALTVIFGFTQSVTAILQVTGH